MTLKDKSIFYLKIFNSSNSTMANTLKVFLDVTDRSGRKDTIEFSAKVDKMLNALLSDCNINAFLKFDEGRFSDCIIMLDTQERPRVITSMELRFESADVAIRNLEIRYAVFDSSDEAKVASMEQFEKLFVNTLSINGDKEGYEIAAKNNIKLEDIKNDASSGYTKEDIMAMISADIKILKCFSRTEKINECLGILEDMRNNESLMNYASLVAVEQQMAEQIEYALANVKKYKDSLLAYDKKG